jgi:hypothetical protein
VIASEDRKEPLGVGPTAFFDVFDPCSVDTEWDLVFGLAGDRAGVTSDANVLIDYKAVLQDVLQST